MVSLVIIILYFVEGPLIDSLCRTLLFSFTVVTNFFWSNFSRVFYLIAVIVYLILNIMVLYLTMDLLIFHIRLYYEGNTTYASLCPIHSRYSHFMKLEKAKKEKEMQERIRVSEKNDKSDKAKLSAGTPQPFNTPQSAEATQSAQSAQASKPAQSAVPIPPVFSVRFSATKPQPDTDTSSSDACGACFLLL